MAHSAVTFLLRDDLFGNFNAVDYLHLDIHKRDLGHYSVLRAAWREDFRRPGPGMDDF